MAFLVRPFYIVGNQSIRLRIVAIVHAEEVPPYWHFLSFYSLRKFYIENAIYFSYFSISCRNRLHTWIIIEKFFEIWSENQPVRESIKSISMETIKTILFCASGSCIRTSFVKYCDLIWSQWWENCTEQLWLEQSERYLFFFTKFPLNLDVKSHLTPISCCTISFIYTLPYGICSSMIVCICRGFWWEGKSATRYINRILCYRHGKRESLMFITG